MSGTLPVQVQELLRTKFSGCSTLAEAFAKHGDHRVRTAIFESRCEELWSKAQLKGYPPKVFLSYRRDSPATIELARKVVSKLERNRFRVFFDEKDTEAAIDLDAAIPRFMARVAESHIFVALITDSYFGEHDPAVPKGLRLWLSEETQKAHFLQHAGLLRVVCLWFASGSPPDAPFDWYFGAVPIVDLRDGNLERLDEALSWNGLIYSDEEIERLADGLLEIEQAIESGQDERVARILASFPTAFLQSDEVRLVEAKRAMRRGDRAAAQKQAISLLAATDAYLPFQLKVCRVLYFLDDNLGVVKGTWPLLQRRRASWITEAHMMIGYCLRDLGFHEAAINHMFCAFMTGESTQSTDWLSSALNEIGCMRLDLDRPRAALPVLVQATQVCPENWQPFHSLIRCMRRLGEAGTAIQLRNSALSRFPDNASSFLLNDPVAISPGTRIGPEPIPEGFLTKCRKCPAEWLCDPRKTIFCGGCGCTRRAGELCRPACGFTEGNPVVQREGEWAPLCPICRSGTLYFTDPS